MSKLIDFSKIAAQVEAISAGKVGKFTQELEEYKGSIFGYAEMNPGISLAKIRAFASFIMVELDLADEAYTMKEVEYKKDGVTVKSTAKEYVVTGEKIRALFKKHGKSDLLPAKKTRDQ